MVTVEKRNLRGLRSGRDEQVCGWHASMGAAAREIGLHTPNP